MGRQLHFSLVGMLTGLSFFAFILLIPVFATEELNLDFTEVGIALAAFSVAVIIASPIWGYFSDKTGIRKRYLIIGSLIFAVTSFLHLYVNNFEQLLLLRFLQGIGFATNPMLTALFTDYFGRQSSRRFSVFSAANSLGWGLGGVLAGIMADLVGIREVFALVSILPLINIYIIAFHLKERPRQQQTQEQPAGKVPGRFVFLYGTMFIRQAAAISLWAIFPIYLQDFVDSFTMIGIASGINMLIQPLFMLMIGKFGSRVDRLNLMLIGLVGSILTFVVYGLAPAFEFIILGQLMIAFSWSLIFIGINLYIIENTPEDTRGRALGLFQSSLTAAAAIGPLLGGPLSDLYGIRNMIFIVTGLMALSFPILLIMKSFDRRTKIESKSPNATTPTD